MSQKKSRQFYCYKFTTDRIAESHYEINDMYFNKARENDEIIAISDNQILRTIRDIKGIDFNPEIVEELIRERNGVKKLPNCQENCKRLRELQDRIDHLLFYPEYVAITICSMSQYDRIAKKGFKINGMSYRRLSCSAGQARSSTVLMCSEDIIDEVKTRLDNGRDKTVPIAPSKLNAYFGLYSSATQVVTEPRFCVVKDFENTVKFKVNYVTETNDKEDDTVDQREIEQTIDRMDGMGLISPRMAEQWAKDLDQDYIPSQFIIRQSFMKGLLTVFDFHQFCEEKNNGNYFVKTIYKDENGDYIYEDLRECDVIISESQFKLWNAYKSKQEYIDNYHKNNIKWGVAQFSPREYENVVFLNYQFIQSLELNEEQIKELCSMFVDWINRVTIEDINYTLLYLVGQNTTPDRIREYLKSWDIYWIKSLIVNKNLLSDKFIREKIYAYLKQSIKRACLGGIPVYGNYQYLISDPYAFMEWVCGKEPKGLLKENEHYSNYWNQRNVDTVDCMRAPLTHFSEHTVLHFKKNEETEKWYKWCNNGIIFNWFGYEVDKLAGCDWDGDIAATTPNKIMLNGIRHDEYPVVCKLGKPVKKIPTELDLITADKFGMGSIIGQITNRGATAYALLPNMEKKYGKESEQYKLLESRLKQTCKAQALQIDKSKIGNKVKGVPACWMNRNFYAEFEGMEEKNEINNECLLDRRPYFFRYLYPESEKEMKAYDKKEEAKAQKMFNKTLKEIVYEKDENLTYEEKNFKDSYYEWCPLLISDSCMNMLCRYIEDTDFKLKQKVKTKNKDFDYHLLMNNEVEITLKDKLAVKQFMKQYMADLAEKVKETLTDKLMKNSKTTEETIKKDIQWQRKYLIREQEAKISNIDVFVNAFVELAYTDHDNWKTQLWNSYGNVLFENLKRNSGTIYYPFKDEKGSIEYLGEKFELKEVEEIEQVF